jgi:hypothetical protein
MGDVTVEVPLASLRLSRLAQRDDTGRTRIEMLHEPLDGAALAGCVATLEQDHMLGTSLL